MRWMGVMFSIFLLIAFGLVFNAVQANSIALASSVAFNIDPMYVGIVLVVLSAMVIFGRYPFHRPASQKKSCRLWPWLTCYWRCGSSA
ncbi:Na+/alanine symporter [Serratia fonticola]|uniref:Na+/alanine symporter n=1 Tax=Serratia fonticola TaxID=47917 RepID=A0A4U9U9G6_SERFO|nr:Na+/alanine symporter [Serratia fonticola]